MRLVQSVIQDGYRRSLTEICNMFEKEGLKISNKLIKQYLADEFGESIPFCDSHRKNQPQLVFSLKLNIKFIANIPKSQDTTKDAAIKIRQALLNTNFELGDKFCDSEELENSWYNKNIPNK